MRLVFGLVILALLGGAAWLGVQSLRRNPEALLRQSVQAEQQGDLAGAEQCMQQYLAARPNDGRALARRGDLLMKLATSASEQMRALQVYEEALRRGRNNPAPASRRPNRDQTASVPGRQGTL